MKQVAIIDMGTNTFHLMLASITADGFAINYREKVPVKIGMGGINQGYITDDGIERAVNTMKTFRNRIGDVSVEDVLAFGTSALRNARNREQVIKSIEESTGIKAQIISGKQEAEYIYKGTRAALKMGSEKSLIMDIGGGSVEFIIGDDKGILWSHSFEIGGQRLLEKYQKHDPIMKEEVDALNNFFSEELTLLFIALKKYNPKTLIGSSGTFETLSDIYCLKNNLALMDTPETPFNLEAFGEIFKEILFKDRTARMQIPGMIEMRVDMIVVTCCLIHYILNEYVFDQIRVSSYSLKEGILASLADNIR